MHSFPHIHNRSFPFVGKIQQAFKRLQKDILRSVLKLFASADCDGAVLVVMV
jgi:hypothetical protein